MSLISFLVPQVRSWADRKSPGPRAWPGVWKERAPHHETACTQSYVLCANNYHCPPKLQGDPKRGIRKHTTLNLTCKLVLLSAPPFQIPLWGAVNYKHGQYSWSPLWMCGWMHARTTARMHAGMYAYGHACMQGCKRPSPGIDV